MEPLLPAENTAAAAHSFDALLAAFENQFNDHLFPPTPANLYNAIDYQLKNGKRLRPVLCLIGNVLAGPLHPDAFLAANALELFHNFTLAHSDVMAAAPLSRSRPALHVKYNVPTAILAGDTLLLYAYDYLNRIQGRYKQKIVQLFNDAAHAVCEGQQMSLDQENMAQNSLSYTDYLRKVILKNAVLLAVSLQTGAIIGGAGIADQEYIYSFGKNTGVALQLQEDYRQAFRAAEQKAPLQHQKNSLLLKTYEWSNPGQRSRLQALLTLPAAEAANGLAQLYKACKADAWVLKEIARLQQVARQHLGQISVPAVNKRPLLELTDLLFDK
jgi:geranylgeranyl diphosphate synthase type II